MWKWLRVGKRIELVMLLLGAFSVLAFAVQAILFYGDDLVLVVIVMVGGVGCTLAICVPTFFYLRRQRTKQSLTTSEGRVSSDRSKTLSRGVLYGLVAGVTVISATYQAYHLDVTERPFGHSTASVFLWNFGILAVVIALLELLRRRNQKQQSRSD